MHWMLGALEVEPKLLGSLLDGDTLDPQKYVKSLPKASKSSPKGHECTYFWSPGRRWALDSQEEKSKSRTQSIL